MEIKKLSTIEFEVEAQKCDHREYSREGGCKADCKKTKYTNSNALINLGAMLPPKHPEKRCDTKTVWTCCSW